MLRFSAISATLVGLAGIVLTSCVPPGEYPPPNFKPNPYGPPTPVGEPTPNRLFNDYRDHNGNPYPRRSDPYAEQGSDDDRYIAPRTPQPQRQQNNTQPAPERKEYPVATRTTKAHEVISPYQPHNVIDVEGFSSGQLARDPSNGKIFRIP